MHYDFREGDTGSILRVHCKDNDTGAVIDVTNSSVNLQWRKASDGSLASVSMTIIDAPNGIVEYKFAAGELTPPGMDFSIKITDPTTKYVTSLNSIFKSVRGAP